MRRRRSCSPCRWSSVATSARSASPPSARRRRRPACGRPARPAPRARSRASCSAAAGSWPARWPSGPPPWSAPAPEPIRFPCAWPGPHPSHPRTRSPRRPANHAPQPAPRAARPRRGRDRRRRHHHRHRRQQRQQDLRRPGDRRRQGRQARRRRQGRDVQEGRHRRPHHQQRHRRRGPLPRLRRPQGRGQGRQRALQVPGHDRGQVHRRARGPQADAGQRERRAMSRRRLAGVLGATALLSAAALPAAADAHGLVGKQDLPIPAWLFTWGAALVLVASFVGLAALWAEPRLQVVRERRVLRLPAVLEVLAGAVGIAVFAGVIYAGFAGVQGATANIEPTVIYVLFWVGIPVVSAVVGDVFRAFNPWLAVGRATGWVTQRVAGEDGGIEPLPYPAWLGRWPVVLGVLIFAWVELVYANKDDPSQLAVMALVYGAVQLVGMSLFGADTWSRRGDAFSVYFGLFARISPLHWRDRAVYRRPLLSGLPSLTPVPGTVVLLCTMIGTTSFDGFSQGTIWNSLVAHLQNDFLSLGLNAEHALEAAGTIGLLGMVALINGLYRLGIMGMHSVDRRMRTGDLAGRFAHTLVPIALAYLVAHYFSLLAYQGQAVVFLASDPLGHGSDLLGTANNTINYTWIGARGIWYVQVGALVIGHVAGLVLAHDRALALYHRQRDATRSQYWMLAVMVFFTSLGLWLLSVAAQQ